MTGDRMHTFCILTSESIGCDVCGDSAPRRVSITAVRDADAGWQFPSASIEFACCGGFLPFDDTALRTVGDLVIEAAARSARRDFC